MGGAKRANLIIRRFIYEDGVPSVFVRWRACADSCKTCAVLGCACGRHPQGLPPSRAAPPNHSYQHHSTVIPFFCWKNEKEATEQFLCLRKTVANIELGCHCVHQYTVLSKCSNSFYRKYLLFKWQSRLEPLNVHRSEEHSMCVLLYSTKQEEV